MPSCPDHAHGGHQLELIGNQPITRAMAAAGSHWGATQHAKRPRLDDGPAAARGDHAVSIRPSVNPSRPCKPKSAHTPRRSLAPTQWRHPISEGNTLDSSAGNDSCFGDESDEDDQLIQALDRRLDPDQLIEAARTAAAQATAAQLAAEEVNRSPHAHFTAAQYCE
jgi:hypothetical protein